MFNNARENEMIGKTSGRGQPTYMYNTHPALWNERFEKFGKNKKTKGPFSFKEFQGQTLLKLLSPKAGRPLGFGGSLKNSLGG